MKTHPLMPLALVLASSSFIACGDSSSAGSGAQGSGDSATIKLVTDPADLPGDEAGLKQAYTGLMSEVVTTLEGIDTEAQLTAGLEKIHGLGPAFTALMKKSEELDVAVDSGGDSPEMDALVDRFEKANQSILQKFPRRAMEIMNAFSAMSGGVGRR